MEQFFGLSTDTLHVMRREYLLALAGAIKENDEFIRDPHVYDRVIQLSDTIMRLTRELVNRHEDVIEAIP